MYPVLCVMYHVCYVMYMYYVFHVSWRGVKYLFLNSTFKVYGDQQPVLHGRRPGESQHVTEHAVLGHHPALNRTHEMA